MVRIGTAGWSVPRELKGEELQAKAGPSTAHSRKRESSGQDDPSKTKTKTRLEKYSRVLGCVEVNSSFYRPHLAKTWERWGNETPAEFRFSIKAPKSITHGARLKGTRGLLEEFLSQISTLAGKTGCLLLQLPPSLEFEAAVAEDFFGELRECYTGDVAFEPRHASWFAEPVDALLREKGIARVAADPAVGGSETAGAGEPGGSDRLMYFRLHGSPRTYYSNYDEKFLVALAERIRGAKNCWVIFDNTARGCAWENAIRLQELVR